MNDELKALSSLHRSSFIVHRSSSWLIFPNRRAAPRLDAGPRRRYKHFAPAVRFPETPAPFMSDHEQKTKSGKDAEPYLWRLERGLHRAKLLLNKSARGFSNFDEETI